MSPLILLLLAFLLCIYAATLNGWVIAGMAVVLILVGLFGKLVAK